MHRLWSYVFLLFFVGCGSSETPDKGIDNAAAPAVMFRTLEKRLLEARTVRLDFHLSAEGVVEADLRGSLEISPTREITLTASGQFGGQPVELLLRAEGEQFELSNGSEKNIFPRPSHLEEALLIGLTRMGILHNLARLVGAAPPDHGDGEVSDWVVVSSFAKDAIDSASISFDLAVAGESAGSASLEIDSHGKPVVRRQTVHFPSGEMRVVEQYSAVTISP